MHTRENLLHNLSTHILTMQLIKLKGHALSIHSVYITLSHLFSMSHLHIPLFSLIKSNQCRVKLAYAKADHTLPSILWIVMCRYHVLPQYRKYTTRLQWCVMVRKQSNHPFSLRAKPAFSYGAWIYDLIFVKLPNNIFVILFVNINLTVY